MQARPRHGGKIGEGSQMEIDARHSAVARWPYVLAFAIMGSLVLGPDGGLQNASRRGNGRWLAA